MPILPFIVVAVGLLVIFIISKLGSNGGLASYGALLSIFVVLAVTGIMFLFTLAKWYYPSCNQFKISDKNGITCIASRNNREHRISNKRTSATERG